MYGEGGVQNISEQIGSQGSHQVSNDVSDNDDCGSKLDTEISLIADDEGHGHREHGEEQFISDTSYSAEQGYACMQEGKNVYHQ